MNDQMTADGVPCQQGCGGSEGPPAYPTWLVDYPSGSQRGFWDEGAALDDVKAYGGRISAKVNPDTGLYEPIPEAPAPKNRTPVAAGSPT